MKVAIICGAGIVSGKERMALELAEGLRDGGTEVHFVTSRWGSGEFTKRANAAGFPTHRLWLGFISATLRLDSVWMTADQLRRLPSLWVGYRRFVKEVQPDRIIHTNWHHALLLWPFLRPPRDIYWIHELMPNKWQYRRLFGGLSDHVDRFIAVSQAAARSLNDLGVSSAKIRVIHNGINDPATDNWLKNENGIQTIGIVGQIGAWKGHEDLLQAFQMVLLDQPRVQLHIFGKGAPGYEMFLHQRADELSVQKNVVWRGFVDDITQIYRDTDLLVVPSRFEEPFGLTAVEAALFAIPVIASRRGGLPEIVEDGVTGCLFEPGNARELAGDLIALLGNAELRRKMGQSARNRAISLFSRDRFVRDFSDLLGLENP